MERIEPKRLMPKELEKPEEPEGQKPKPKLLIVEDEELPRKVAFRALTSRYEIHTVVDADDAKATLEEHGGMPVLSDFNYPGGGLENLFAWMKAHKEDGIRNSPVAGMSGENIEDLKKLSARHGFEILPKPFDVRELIAMVGRLYETPKKTQ